MLPLLTVRLVGVTLIVKSPTCVTTSDTAAVRVRGPLVARIVNPYVPAGVDAEVDTVIVVDPEAIKDAGLKETDAPAGNPVTLNATFPVNPGPPVTVAV